MTPNFNKVALALLADLGDRQSNAGCNDFHLAEHIPDVEERRALMKKFHELNGDPDEFNPAADYTYVMDFEMTFVFERMIKDQLN